MRSTLLSTRTLRAFAVVAALAVAGATLLALGIGPTVAQESPPPIAMEPLTGRHEFTDDVTTQIRLRPDGRPRKTVHVREPSKLATVRITVQPGARFPWHTHPGPVIVAVTEGELVYAYADDCERRPYPTGTAFVDPGANVHTAYNPSTSEETVVVATFFGGPAQGPLTIPVDAQKATALDAKCRFQQMAHAH